MINDNLIIDEEGVKINNILINEKIFQKEKVEYSPREREDEIEHLCSWIAESKSQSDKTLMLQDLKYLMGLDDEFIFSSISTNEYIAKSDNICIFDNICEEILKLNKEDYPDELSEDESDFYDSKNFCEGKSYKEDYNKAIKYAKKINGQIYTMVDGENNHTFYLKGLHYVNRFGFCVLKKVEVKNE